MQQYFSLTYEKMVGPRDGFLMLISLCVGYFCSYKRIKRTQAMVHSTQNQLKYAHLLQHGKVENCSGADSGKKYKKQNYFCTNNITITLIRYYCVSTIHRSLCSRWKC
uniref:Uncharacterized protein n=1 Tax=Arundo donax TaxID=35708 RepID=A0A0A9C9G0_ARUDO